MEIILDDIYVTQGKTYYAVTEYEQTMTALKHKVLPVTALLAEMEKSTKCDFAFEDEVLRCNPLIEPVEIDTVILNRVMSQNDEVNGLGRGTLYSILAKGVEEGYVLLDGDDREAWSRGESVAKFRDVAFSQSTMTAHALMHNGDGELFNKMLVTMDDGVLEFHPFKFGTTEDIGSLAGCHALNEEFTVNGEKFQLYETEMLSIYDEVSISLGLVNQCMCDTKIFKTCISVVQDFINGVSGSEARESTWAGSGKNYKSVYGVYFKSSCANMPALVRSELQRIVLETIGNGGTSEDAVEAGKEYLKRTRQLNRMSSFVLTVLASVAGYKSDLTGILKNAFAVCDSLKRMVFWAELYTYRVRTDAYLSKKSLTPVSRPVLAGGNTVEYTTVNSIFYY